MAGTFFWPRVCYCSLFSSLPLSCLGSEIYCPGFWSSEFSLTCSSSSILTVNTGWVHWKGECLPRGDVCPADCVASEICYFSGVEKFLRAISVNERSKSDGSDKVPLRRTTQKFDSSWIFLPHGDWWTQGLLPFCFEWVYTKMPCFCCWFLLGTFIIV